MKGTKGRTRLLTALLAALMLVNAGAPALAAPTEGREPAAEAAEPEAQPAAGGYDEYIPGYIDGTKTAELIDLEQGIYEITLQISGEPATEKNVEVSDADVVLVLDLSGSMDDSSSPTRWEKTKAAIEPLVDLLLEDGDSNNRMAIVGYASTDNGEADPAHNTLVDFTGDPREATAWMAEGIAQRATWIRMSLDIPTSNTNAHAGLIAAEEVFAADPSQREQFVIFLTDGAANRYYSSYVDRDNWVEAGTGANFLEAAGDAALAKADELKADGVTIFAVPTFTAEEEDHKKIVEFMRAAASSPDHYYEAEKENIEELFIELGKHLLSSLERTVEHTGAQVVDPMSEYVDYDTLVGCEAQRRLRGASGQWATGTEAEVGAVSYDRDTRTLTWTIDEYDSYYEYRIVYRVQVKEEYTNVLLHDDQTSGADPTGDDPAGVIANGYTYVTSDIMEDREILVPSVSREREVTVTFHWNDGRDGDDTYHRETVKVKDTVPRPADPAIPGYVFGGWYLEPACETAYDFDEPVVNHLDLYAKWDRQTYDVIYHANDGGDDTHGVTEFVLDDHRVLSVGAAGFSRAGYGFLGWSYDADGAAVLQAGDTVESPGPGGEVHLYAVWTRQTYDVIYHANDGGDDTHGVTEFVLDDHRVLSTGATGFSRAGYGFLGWSYTPDGAAALQAGDTVESPGPGGEVHLYAVWVRQTYNVIYHANDGGNLTYGFTESVLDSHRVLDNGVIGFSRAGYSFLGWSRQSDAVSAGVPADSTVGPGGSGETIHLYAVWEALTYDVVYHANNGGSDTHARTEHVLDDHLVLDNGVTAFSWADHDFLGWSTDPEATAPGLHAGDTLAAAEAGETIHLYAVWLARYTVTFHWNTDEVDEDIYHRATVFDGETAVRPVDPVLDGFVFGGWYLEPGCDTAYDFSAPVHGDLDLYALWDPEVFIPSVSEEHYAYLVGYEDNTVRPSDSITRAEVATIFFRIITDEDRERIWSTTNDYSDVTGTDWYNNAISTISNGGLFEGYPTGRFEPDGAITRAEFATVAARFLEVTAYTGEDLFTDIGDHWAREAINIAAEHGWLSGYNDGTFLPDDPIKRAEVATIINRMRACEVHGEEDLLEDMITWPDNQDTTEWYYFAIQEATNSHHYDLDDHDDNHEIWTSLRTPRDWTVLEQPDSLPGDIL